MQRFLKVFLIVLGGIPLLLVATCAYTTYSPHLLIDPINAALYRAPPVDEKRWWRSVDVTLTPGLLKIGAMQEVIEKRLAGAGYELFADYTSLPVGNRSFPTDGTTHKYIRGGRTKFACGEVFFVEIGFVEARLAAAKGHNHWTCL